MFYVFEDLIVCNNNYHKYICVGSGFRPLCAGLTFRKGVEDARGREEQLKP